MNSLPKLQTKELAPTRDYLREVALVLGSLQRAYLPKHPRDWQHGLEINLRGISTQAFKLNDQEIRASLDLVRQKVRLDGNKWPLRENPPSMILAKLQDWLKQRGESVRLDEPEFKPGTLEYDPDQTEAYATALWWMEQQFRLLKTSLTTGLTSPILLYPHHFDLSLVWFPFADARQLAIGFSTGDQNIAEPYIYLSAYPEPKAFKSIDLPSAANWQTTGFSAAILAYAALQQHDHPEKLFQQFSAPTFKAGRQLFAN